MEVTCNESDGPPIYARLIQRGLKTISDVPENIRVEVEKLLQESGDEQD